MKKIGEILLENKAISEKDLNKGLNLQKLYREKIGNILVAEDRIKEEVFLQNLAKQQSLKTIIEIENIKFDTSLLREEEIETYLKLKFLPIRKNNEEVEIISSDTDKNLEDYLALTYKNYTIVLTPFANILAILEQVFSFIKIQRAINELAEKIPKNSAKLYLESRYLNKILLLVCLIFILGIVSKTALFIILTLSNLYFFSVILFKLISFFIGVKEFKKSRSRKIVLPSFDTLPIYSILVPLYKEKEAIVEGLVMALKRLNYPKTRLDIKLVVEEDDLDTVKLALKFENSYIMVIKTPYSIPRTKPKAINYALAFIRGEVVSVFDAEDRPNPNQLLIAVNGLKTASCVQAELTISNYKTNLLPSFFKLEYDFLFKFYLRALEKLGVFIPLGGTSNHIRTKDLKELYGWDAFNVTEDAELGLRLFEKGKKTSIINSETLEDAPKTIKNWFNQRVRWIKGHIKTFLIHSKASDGFNFAEVFNLWFVLGLSSLIYLITPFVVILSVVGFLNNDALPLWLYGFSLFNFCFFVGVNIFIYGAVAIVLKEYRLVLYSLVIWLYFLLHILASVEAVRELITKPFFWRKTEH